MALSFGKAAWRVILAVLVAAVLVPSPRAGAETQPGDLAKAALPAGTTYVTSVEGVHEYRLANGLQVLLLPDLSTPSITVAVTYRVGSRHEGYGESGMAHLLEHLVFKGTPKHTNIPHEFKQKGARANGTTNYDRTNYFETFPASAENLAWAVELEADRMVNSFIARKDLDSEMTVVRNEFEIGENSPGRVLGQRVSATAFQWHNYGKSTIGNRSDIENVGIERLQAFYRRFYQPDNATFVIAGKFETAAALELVARHFGPIARPSRVLPQEYTVEPTQQGERSIVVRRAGDNLIAAVAYRIMSAQHEDVGPFYVLADALSSSPSGRLYERLVKTGKATSASMGWFAGFDPGLATATAYLRKGESIEAARDELIATIEGVAGQPIGAEEVERAKARFAVGFERGRLDTHAFAIGLSSAIASGDWRLRFWQRDRIASVTVEDVQRAARHYFKSDNRTVGLFIPTDNTDRVEIPPRRDASSVLAGYRGKQEAAAVEEFDPSLENIERRTQRLSLSNGIKVALLPKSTRGDRVHARLALHSGDPASVKGWGAAPAMLSSLMHRGTKRLSRTAFQDELTRLKASMSIGVSTTGIAADLSTTRENLEPTLRLLMECLREPALDEQEFEQIRRERLLSFDSASNDPLSRGGNRMAVLFNAYDKDDPRYSGTLGEVRARWTDITLDKVRRFHGEIVSAQKGELAVVGAFEPAGVPRLAEELLAGINGSRPYARLKAVAVHPEPVVEVIETPDKANAILLARQNIVMRDANLDYPALIVANHIFGSGSMASRLGTRLRQKEGLSYGSGSNLSANAVDEVGAFTIRASFAPQNVARVEAAVREELARVIADGFTAAEVEDAKKGLLESRRLARMSDASIAASLTSSLFRNRTMRWSITFEQRLAMVTAEAASAAFRRYIDPARLVVVKAGDFARDAGKAGSR